MWPVSFTSAPGSLETQACSRSHVTNVQRRHAPEKLVVWKSDCIGWELLLKVWIKKKYMALLKVEKLLQYRPTATRVRWETGSLLNRASSHAWHSWSIPKCSWLFWAGFPCSALPLVWVSLAAAGTALPQHLQLRDYQWVHAVLVETLRALRSCYRYILSQGRGRICHSWGDFRGLYYLFWQL